MATCEKLKGAEAALGKGDYNQCIQLLERLCTDESIPDKLNGQAKLMMVTACMGQGNEKKALEICQELLKHKDPSSRQDAKQFLSILNAPTLQRPQDWSVKIPNLNLNNSNEELTIYKRKSPPSNDYQPPTGETKGLQLGFTGFVFIILLGLTLLLSGCVNFTTEIHLIGPDKLQLGFQVESNSNSLLPWQKEFASSFKKQEPKLRIETPKNGLQLIKTSIINSTEARLIIEHFIQSASEVAGLDLPPPKITLKEKNWLIGVKQDLNILVDLQNLPEIPGMRISLIVIQPPYRGNIKGIPNPIDFNDSNIQWSIKQGVLNQLNLQDWRWSKLGIGVIFVIFIWLVVLVLQNLRVQMGYGFPELPP